jgi:drug/metabolite transporter (DMT)-like permease/predicted alpha/beta hydrolase family esterase
MIAEAEQRISSALTGVLIASEPLWVALLATRLDRTQRSSRRGVLGVLIGLVGVALLLGVDNAHGRQLVGGLLVVAAAACYAGAALWLPRAKARVEPRPLIAAGLAVAGLLLAPFAAASLPTAAPPTAAVVSLAVLGVVGTALGFSMWFALLGRIGAARASLVTYTSPVVAVALGAVALGESFHPDALVGAGLIFVGSVLAARGTTVAARAPQSARVDRTKTGVSPTEESHLASLASIYDWRSVMTQLRNVVLVHGGFVDGSGWQGVYNLLRADGFNVSVVQNPTLSLEGDVAFTRRVLDGHDGPTILVGHSYGGAVITEAGNHGKVAGLAYIAAFAPDQGESVGSLIAGFPADGPQPPILPPQDGFLLLDRDKFAASFAADVSPELAAFMADAQVPWNVDAPAGVIGQAAWRTKPTWYLVSTDDRMIPPPSQRAMAERIGATVTEAPGSHAIYVSQPAAVVDLITQAARSALLETTSVA